MGELVDLSFVTDGTLQRIIERRRHEAEGIQEIFAYKLDRLQEYAEDVAKYARTLKDYGVDCREELKSATENLSACALLAQILWREHGGAES